MVIASKKWTKRKGLRSSNHHRDDRVKLTSYKCHGMSSRNPMYQYLFKEIDQEKKKNGGNIPKYFFLS